MKVLLFYLSISCTLLHGQVLPVQILVVDRGMRSHAQGADVPVENTKGLGFIADHFTIGAAGEVWIVDTIRTWSRAGESSGHNPKLGDTFQSLALFGGIEAVPPQPGQPTQPDCDCHNLMTIKSAQLQPGVDQLQNGDVTVTTTAELRMLEFQKLHWSVPGGVNLQFGVMGTARRGTQWWGIQAAPTNEPHTLKLFDEKGKFRGPYETEDQKLALNVQVWAHMSASIAVRSASAIIEVSLRSESGVDAAKADPATLRFGPGNAAPLNTHIETADGRNLMVARFRRADTAIPSGVVSACLTGRLQSGVPFEGCDLVATK